MDEGCEKQLRRITLLRFGLPSTSCFQIFWPLFESPKTTFISIYQIFWSLFKNPKRRRLFAISDILITFQMPENDVYFVITDILITFQSQIFWSPFRTLKPAQGVEKIASKSNSLRVVTEDSAEELGDACMLYTERRSVLFMTTLHFIMNSLLMIVSSESIVIFIPSWTADENWGTLPIS